MSEDIGDIDLAAAQWHVAQDSDTMDWTGFTSWLEADPRHRSAFDAIVLLDERIDEALPVLRQIAPPSDAEGERVHRARPLRWMAAGGAFAAAAALGIVLLPNTPTPIPASYRTSAGQVRDVQLADGSTATIAPGSVLEAGATRDAPMTLSGSASFAVRHDAARPLTIRAGGYEIRDIGTRFELTVSGTMLRASVSEGRIAVRSLSGTGEVEVAAGQVLTSLDPTASPTLAPLRAGPPSGWRAGRLVYDDVPLGLVVADIARSTGKRIVIEPTVAHRRFSGVLAAGSADEMTNALTELASLSKKAEDDAIRLSDGTRR